jgi:uncharacterized protein (DUF1810 family)
MADKYSNPDWLKPGSFMTLFDYVSPNDVFDRVLCKFYAGARDLYGIYSARRGIREI